MTERYSNRQVLFTDLKMSHGEIFASKEFVPEKYVNDISAQCVGGTELINQKAKLQTVSDETHSALKKNVYQHYEQFIDTAKDISYLAGEMYQISQMLRDQRNLIQSLQDISILGTKKPTTQTAVTPTEPEAKNKPALDENRKKLLGVLEKVEGAAEVTEDDNRILVFEGDLLEIDPVQRKRGYLFNDGIMLAVWVPNRRGPQRYKFQAFYELGSIGLVVNIRDPECPKHTFKLLIFPSVHLLQCPNQQDKDSWVNQIESMQKILRNPQKAGLIKSTSTETPTHEAHVSMDSERAKSPEDSMGMVSIQHPLPEWISDIPEDLDVWIAQRNFVEAVNHYESFQEFIETQPNTSNLKDIKLKVEMRIKTLIDILVSDLEIMTPEKILQGGPRSIRKSVDLLVRLGRENQASQLFLAHRSAFIKQRLKRLKTEGRSQLYLDHMAVIFFSNIVETMKEYKRSFSDKTAGTACLVVWINTEVVNFINSYCRQLFSPQAHLSSVSKSVAKLRMESQQLIDFGMDVSCTVDSLLLPQIERTVVDAKDKLIEAVRHRYRSPDEIGVPMKFAEKASLARTVAELTELGVEDVKNYLEGENSFKISNNTISFAKSWLHFCHDVMLLIAPEWQTLIETAICEVILVELKHLERAKKKISNSKVLEVIEKDVIFVLDSVCKVANEVYEGGIGHDLPELSIIVSDYASLKVSSSPTRRAPVPVPRTQLPTRSKYTTPELMIKWFRIA